LSVRTAEKPPQPGLIAREAVLPLQDGLDRGRLPGPDVLYVIDDPFLEVDDARHAHAEALDALPDERVNDVGDVLQDLVLRAFAVDGRRLDPDQAAVFDEPGPDVGPAEVDPDDGHGPPPQLCPAAWAPDSFFFFAAIVSFVMSGRAQIPIDRI
jgi:hypothetical protein